MRNSQGTIIYVGKAVSLRNRVRSYFNNRQQPEKTRLLVTEINDIDFFITGSEEEALILELNLIKKYMPYYNIRLKDDKTYPYLVISLNEDWPSVQITRRPEDNGGRYFGPFANVRSVHRTLKVIRNIFPFRSCSQELDGKLSRPCLEYHMHKCSGPCINAISREEYARIIKQLILFLEGKQETVIRQLESRMKQAVDKLEYEKAAVLRDQIQAVRDVINWQKLATRVKGEQDVIALYQDGDTAYVQIFLIRNGKLIGKEGFTMQGTKSEEPGHIMTDFVKQYYASAANIPALILLQHPIEDKEVIRNWLQKKKGRVLQIQVPRIGDKKQLIDTVVINARRGMEELKIKQISAPNVLQEAMNSLREELGLSRAPSRIEGYDISNIQGKDAVGSMVVFEKGKPRTSHYRRFRIKTVSRQTTTPCCKRSSADVSAGVKKNDPEASVTWAIIPDLMLIDGGKGQLSSVMEILKDSGIDSIPVIGLAKENEEIFMPGQSQPIILPKRSPALQLLQRIRDEAHRFAVGYHPNIHKKKIFVSALDAVPGIGPARKRALLKHFGSVKAVKSASVDDLSSIDGMNPALAQKIKEYLE
jgi:excinuclease ABC subunit C